MIKKKGRTIKEDKHLSDRLQDLPFWINIYLSLPEICKHCEKRAKHWDNKSIKCKKDKK